MFIDRAPGIFHGMDQTIAPPQTTPLPELIDLTDRTAIVTGGAMGIGLGIPEGL
jgi:hypothetical protein